MNFMQLFCSFAWTLLHINAGFIETHISGGVVRRCAGLTLGGKNIEMEDVMRLFNGSPKICWKYSDKD